MPIKDIPYSNEELFGQGPQKTYTGRPLKGQALVHDLA